MHARAAACILKQLLKCLTDDVAVQDRKQGDCRVPQCRKACTVPTKHGDAEEAIAEEDGKHSHHVLHHTRAGATHGPDQDVELGKVGQELQQRHPLHRARQPERELDRVPLLLRVVAIQMVVRHDVVSHLEARAHDRSQVSQRRDDYPQVQHLHHVSPPHIAPRQRIPDRHHARRLTPLQPTPCSILRSDSTVPCRLRSALPRAPLTTTHRGQLGAWRHSLFLLLVIRLHHNIRARAVP
mmetsp:Transcript_27626/g.88854  ORF Transcript_27626/g.88854 Transcript_27626/m.88854 type:complete len:239 (-) Transcript_27626:870-1586(-)